MISKLDEIQELGFETIWVSPFYKSPGRDHGYDVSDYLDVDPMMGTLEDAKLLINEVHKRKMKILFDMVLNHTSEEHPWFKESRSSVDNPKRDWYLWAKEKNNWISMVGKPGWNFDPLTKEYYYTNFLFFQPDLNFNHPEVKKSMFDAMRFWLGLGVDGFRLDIFNSIFKDESKRDNPFVFRYFPTPDNNDEVFFQKKIYTLNHPKNFELAKEVKKLTEEFGQDRCLLGEVSGNDSVLKKFLGEPSKDATDGLNLVFQFELIHYVWSASFFKDLLVKNETVYPKPYLPTYVFGNHDQPRSIERINGDLEKAKILALFQLTARGVPVVYYGEEIGLRGGDFSPRESTDPLAKDLDWAPKWLLKLLDVFVTRDDARTPMQWDSTSTSGFTSPQTKPWLPFTGEKEFRNVEYQKKNPNSIWNTYKTLISLRKREPVLHTGGLKVLETGNYGLLGYIRFIPNAPELGIFINFSNQPIDVSKFTQNGKQVYSTNQLIVNESGNYLSQNSGMIWKYEEK
ncbi:oligo-1,6-glucosidase [Leptospira kobayashii]|uniref:Oligo-1,6-glucosidase n=2 Tax=Leptospira kobayashii TaxID=1917830 RepID=A0ABN6KI07_9LEPT|nr:oligo-1,6-glucosidase [Leptospira kobayashii]